MKKGICFLVGAAAVLAGCASPQAGGTAGGIYISNSPYARIYVTGDGNGVATAAPETTGQTATGPTVSPTVSVPASVLPSVK